MRAVLFIVCMIVIIGISSFVITPYLMDVIVSLGYPHWAAQIFNLGFSWCVGMLIGTFFGRYM